MVNAAACGILLALGLLHVSWCLGQGAREDPTPSAAQEPRAAPASRQVFPQNPAVREPAANPADGFSPPAAAGDPRTVTIQGKVATLGGQALAGARVWVVSPSPPPGQPAEARTDESGSFALNMTAGAPTAPQLVMGVSHPVCVEGREVLDLAKAGPASQPTLLLRTREEKLDEPSLEALEKWLLPRLSKRPGCKRVTERTCKGFRAALARYRKQPTDTTTLEQVWQTTQNVELPEARLLAALALVRLGAFAGAESLLASAVAAPNVSGEALLLQGIRWNFLHRPNEATKCLDKALKALPKNGLVELELGRAAFLAEDWPIAEEKLTAALAHRAPPAPTRYLRARTFEAEGQLEAATREAEALAKCVRQQPLPPAVQRLVMDLQGRAKEWSLRPIESVMEQSVAELTEAMPALRGLDPAISPSPDDLLGILQQTGSEVERFFRDFSNVAATEVIQQSRLGAKGKVRGLRREGFYYVFFSRFEKGGSWIEEFRADQAGRAAAQGGLDAGFMTTSGFVAGLVVFHPEQQPGMVYRLLGQQVVDGGPAYVIGFAQQPETSPPMGEFRLGGSKVGSYHVQGIAWISAEQWRLLRLHTDLLRPLPRVGLKRLTTEIVYRSYRFASVPGFFWLPRRVTVFLHWGRRQLRNDHVFSKFQFFKVEMKQSRRESAEAKAEPAPQ